MYRGGEIGVAEEAGLGIGGSEGIGVEAGSGAQATIASNPNSARSLIRRPRPGDGLIAL